MYKIMLVEDDTAIAGLLGEQLEKWGYAVYVPNTFDKILESFNSFTPHIILMDITLPHFDGYYWCQKIREHSKLPILFMSSRDSNMDMIMAINLGADDYITKPFDMNLLLAKITALLRRSYAYQEQSRLMVEYNGLLLDIDLATLSFRTHTTELTKNELRIVKMLMEKAPQIVLRTDLIRLLWEHESFVDDNTLTVNVNRIRRKLDTLGLSDLLQTKKGLGYYLK